MFEPEVEDSLPTGLQVHESLLSLPRGNCAKLELDVTNITSHVISLPGRTFLSTIQMIQSVNPVELKFKEFPDQNITEHSTKTQTEPRENWRNETEHPASQTPVNAVNYDEKLVPEVSLGDHLSKQEKDTVKQMLSEECDCFISDDQDVGCAEDLQLKLNLSDSTPMQQNYIAVPRPLYPELKQYIEDLLNRGFIKNSKSPYSSSCVIVRKKGGSVCLCIDYRELNKKTISDRHPIPRIQDTLVSLAGQKYFSMIDQGKAYH